MKAPPVSISCRDLTLRFPVYGVDAKSLKKHLAKITVGGKLARSHGTTEVTALSNLNLELKAGDRLGLIGHNGSGKTTLLRALSGAYEPDEGAIEVQGHIAALLDLNLGIDPSATGMDNIRLRGRIAGLPGNAGEDLFRRHAGAPRLRGGHRRRGRRAADGRMDRGGRCGLPEDRP
jgi:lipopolysaccharide transport system ATP-binding protein